MKTLTQIAKQVSQQGGNLYFVGGFVRDAILGIANDDIDLAVEGIGFDTLVSIVTPFASHITKEAVGGTFAVVKATVDGLDLDFALCRGEVKVGDSHTDFSLNFSATIFDDLLRRDLTINAIAQNVLTGVLLDPFNGQTDLANKIARNVSDAFVEDALRVVRAARFIARFGLTPSESLIDICKKLSPANVSKERFGMELVKTLKQATKPSLFFQFLDSVGWLKDVFAELHALKGVQQSALHHPEGDAFIHTLMCVDAAKDWFTRTVMLCHDLGKSTTTVLNKQGQWAHPAHEKESVTLAKTLLANVKFEGACGGQKVVDKVLVLVELHMLHTTPEVGNKSLLKKVRTLQAAGLQFAELVKVMRADMLGSTKTRDFSVLDILSQRVDTLTTNGVFTPVVTGKMLVSVGLKPSPQFAQLLALAQTLQDNGTLNANNWMQQLGL